MYLTEVATAGGSFRRASTADQHDDENDHQDEHDGTYADIHDWMMPTDRTADTLYSGGPGRGSIGQL